MGLAGGLRLISLHRSPDECLPPIDLLSPDPISILVFIKYCQEELREISRLLHTPTQIYDGLL